MKESNIVVLDERLVKLHEAQQGRAAAHSF